MLILSMESTAKSVSCAVCHDTELIGQCFQNSGLTHSRTLLAMTESLMKNLDVSVSDVGLIAVARGPGSFTGVRIGVSAAKGLAWGLDIPVCGVSTLEAMVCQIQETREYDDHVICPVMDARRGQVYNALFELRHGSPFRLCDDRAVSLADLSAELIERGKPRLLLGDGAAISYEYLTSNGISCSIAPELLRWQTAYGVALAAANAEPSPATMLEPSYLRPSQAERERGIKSPDVL